MPKPNASDALVKLRLDDQFCFALYTATNAVTRAYKPLLGALGLTYPQYLVMLTLWQDGPAPNVRIAERLKLGANAITPLVDQLAAAGFVERRRDTADRRIVTIALTETGLGLEHAAATAQSAVVCRTGLAEDSLDELRDQLNALVARMTEHDEAAEDETV